MYGRNQAQEITTHSWTNDLYQWTGASNSTRAYTANGLNQYVTAAGNSIVYDSNGNMSGDGTWTYTYDADNQLRSANGAGITASLAYDAVGRLRQTTIGAATINLLYSAGELVADYDTTGNLLHRYVHGPGTDEPIVQYDGADTTAKTWFYRDHLGSVVGTANASGTSTAIYTYGPYGEPNVAGSSRFRYTGQQFISELGLYYYKARFYSPTLGRFLQTDPIGYADDLNLYGYTAGDPLNNTDPSGLSSAKPTTGAEKNYGDHYAQYKKEVPFSGGDGPSTNAMGYDDWTLGKGYMTQETWNERRGALATGAGIGLGLLVVWRPTR